MTSSSSSLTGPARPDDQDDTGLMEPRSVALMFALALGDTVEYRPALDRLVAPGSLGRWGDFRRAAEAIDALAPWRLSGFTAFDTLDPDVAFVRVCAATGSEPVSDGRPGDGVGTVTVVRLAGGGGRWFVSDFRRPQRSRSARRLPPGRASGASAR
jgi:hypothetical protein